MATTAFRTLLKHEYERGNARSIVAITRLMLTDAFVCGASDIHIDPTPDITLVRLRIDGLLATAYSLPKECHLELISHIKILSRLRIDEHLRPQDGRFTFVLPDSATEFDIRVSTLPTQHGECTVLRLLVTPVDDISLTRLGVTDEQEVELRRALTSSHGMVLIVGPTGSGKTTTLYGIIRELSGSERSIISIEDPIEYSLPGARQVQVQHGLTFAAGLRAILRQDPDIIIVGEMRDPETATLAVGAAHTGHLVLSTLHATSAESAFARLEELGVSRRRLQAIDILIIAQRLIRNHDGPGRHGEFTFLHA